ncbi:hypothetical protein BB560_003653, partial [Smittium megazygosporum]
LNFGVCIHHLKKVTENLRFRIISNDSESQTAISGLGRRVGQLDAGQTKNAEYQEPTATRLVLPSSSSKGSLHRLVKRAIFNSISPVHTRKTFPTIVDTRKNAITYTKHFSKMMKQSGGVVYSDFLLKDSVVLSEYAKEYASLNEFVLNSIEGQLATGSNFRKESDRICHLKISRLLGKLYCYKKVKISDLLIYVFSELSYTKILGKLKKVNRLFEHESENINFDDFSIDKNIGIPAIRRLYEENFPFDPTQFTIVIISALQTMIMIQPTRLLNIIVDFSSNPALQNLLINEQKSIIKRYGKNISLQTLQKMEYLNAAFLESLLLSAPA